MIAARLMSFWDMLKVDAKPFVSVMYTLGNIRQTLLGDMQRGRTEMPNEGLQSGDPLSLKQLRSELDALGLRVSLLAADRLIESVAKSPAQLAEILQGISDLAGRVQDELGVTYLLSLSADEQRLIEPGNFPFGQLVAQQFPSLISEVENGSKCMGFGLPTASVFHHIRCLEAGIAAMSRCLGIADPTRGADRSWMKLLGKIKTAIDAKWPPGPIRTGDALFFEEAHAALAAIQNPYRNSTMHLDQRYDAGDAQHIKAMVDGFMRKLASRMDEQGLPLA